MWCGEAGNREGQQAGYGDFGVRFSNPNDDWKYIFLIKAVQLYIILMKIIRK